MCALNKTLDSYLQRKPSDCCHIIEWLVISAWMSSCSDVSNTELAECLSLIIVAGNLLWLLQMISIPDFSAAEMNITVLIKSWFIFWHPVLKALTSNHDKYFHCSRLWSYIFYLYLGPHVWKIVQPWILKFGVRQTGGLRDSQDFREGPRYQNMWNVTLNFNKYFI